VAFGLFCLFPSALSLARRPVGKAVGWGLVGESVAWLVAAGLAAGLAARPDGDRLPGPVGPERAWLANKNGFV
jgi:hypothetical protein